jgi:hypothetical protein
MYLTGIEQVLPEASLSYNETPQPKYSYINTRSYGCRTKDLGEIWYDPAQIGGRVAPVLIDDLQDSERRRQSR